MARQNIDEMWKTDPRRTLLVERLGSGRLADGMRVEVNWLLMDQKGKPIPLKKFQFVKDWQVWIDCGLAEIIGDDVKIAGADAYSDFFDKQKSNASKGGKAKAAQRKPKVPKSAQKRPECPSLSSSISLSSSFSGSSTDSVVENPSDSKPQLFIATYCRQFKTRWGVNPPIQGKDSGIVTRLAKSMSLDRFEFLIRAYFEMPDAWIVKQKHTLGIFESKLNEVAVWAESGQFTTQRQVQQADDMASNHLLMEKLKREGK